jgi:[glutamine synthetase] adenylyltransferase / [glutamine synthetase]-adenylyl-L-tyrosine phosphorylase
MPLDLDEARRLRERQMRELVKPGSVSVKHSAGGLIDIEYGVQYLQVLQGCRWPRVRTPSTLLALERLAECGLLVPDEARAVSAAYRFLRRVIDGLRMVRGNAKDLVLPAQQTDEMRFLARRLGYVGTRWDAAAERLAADIGRQMGVAHAFYQRRCGLPTLASE